MCDSRRPLNGSDSGVPPSSSPPNGGADTFSETPTYSVWLSRAVNGGWDSPMPPQAQDAAGTSTESVLRLVA